MTTKAAYRRNATPSPALIIRANAAGEAFYEAKFRHEGVQVRRRIGRGWLDRSETGEWVPRRGRVADGYFDAPRAHAAADAIAKAYISGEEARAKAERERREHGVTFGEVARSYLTWLEHGRAKPSTLADYGLMLSEPGTKARRRSGFLRSHIMRALGDKPAAKISASDIRDLLDTIAETGASARTRNKHLNLIAAIFNYGMREETFGLSVNPAHSRLKDPEPDRGVLVYYRTDEIEALARELAASGEGTHHTDANGAQDGDMVRVAAYCGLRLGELLALRWRDIYFEGHVLTISRAMSAGVETTTKSGRVRQVPLSDQAAAALDRISRMSRFTGPDELVFCNAIGRHMDGSAFRRRYRRAQQAAGVSPLRVHDLRHTFGSLCAAGGVDLVTIQAWMGHSDLATTGRYLHARPASEKAAELTRVFGASSPATPAPATVGVS